MKELYTKNIIPITTIEDIFGPRPLMTGEPLVGVRVIGGEISGASYRSAASGARLEIFPENDPTIGMVMYNSAGTEVFKTIVDGTDNGDVTIGNYSGGQGAQYDSSADKFTFTGTLEAGSIHIPDEDTTANSFHTNTTGNSWWGCTSTDFTADNDNANAYVLNTGVAKFQSITLSGNVILSGLQAGSAIDGQYLDALSVVGASIANLTITAGKIGNNEITATQVAATTITATEIANNTITATQIAAATVTTTEIAANTIVAGNIAASTITTTEIANNTIVAGNIAASTITTTEIANNTIVAGNIAASTITTTEISNTAGIVGGQIANLTIAAANIVNLTITAAQIANSTITGGKIVADTITGSLLKIGNQSWSHDLAFSVTDADTVAWAGGTITMADGSTTYSIDAGNTGNMAARTYVYLDIDTSVTVLQTTTTAGTATGDGKILIAVAENSTSQATFQVFGGIGGIGITGGDIENSSITNTQIAANTITANEIGANVITASEIAAGTITTTEIAANTIVAGNIAAATITGTEIAATTIAAANIAANTITANEIAANTITATQIAASTITATEMNIATLSAITADIGAITAGSITGVTITGGTFQTAAAGQRITITGADNYLKFFGAANLIVTLGGSSDATARVCDMVPTADTEVMRILSQHTTTTNVALNIVTKGYGNALYLRGESVNAARTNPMLDIINLGHGGGLRISLSAADTRPGLEILPSGAGGDSAAIRVDAGVGAAGTYEFQVSKTGDTIIGDLTNAGKGYLHIKGDDDSDDDPGCLVLYAHNGVPYYLWVDNTGDLRIHTAAPTDEDADGDIVGTQV